MGSHSGDYRGVAIISGGSRGIGRAFVLEAAARGYRVVFGYRSREADAGQVCEVVASRGGMATAVRGDLAEPQAIEALAAAGEAAGPVALLINNAGVVEETALPGLTAEAWAQAIAINLTAPCFLVRRLADSLAANRGAVLNISSTGGVAGSLHGAAYGATKAGLIGLTRTLARELAPEVRVNAIAPGPVATEMWAAIPEETQRLVERETPLRRIATPEDMARAGLDICSWPDITGQVIVIDGGRIMG